MLRALPGTNETHEIGSAKGFDYWDGSLPGPPVATPRIALDSTALHFVSLDGATPASEVVTVSNSGVGTLTDVTVEGDPAWLTVERSGSGNTQTLTNSVDPAGLQPGVYDATITVSDGGASNVERYTVHIRWTAQNISQVDLSYSTDAGETVLLVVDRGILTTDSDWGDFVWVVPQLSGDSIMVCVGEYGAHDVIRWSPNIALSPSSAVLGVPLHAQRGHGIISLSAVAGGLVTASVVTQGLHAPRLQLLGLDGTLIASRRVSVQPGVQQVSWAGVATQPASVLVVRLVDSGCRDVGLVTVVH